MADAQLKLSRRTLLGAAFAVPFVPSAVEGPLLLSSSFPRMREPSGPSSLAAERLDPRFRGDDGVWGRALASFRRAEAAVAALEGDPDEDAFGRALDAFNIALRRLIAVPAPDVAALATKLEAAAAAELAEMTYAPPALAALARDARSLGPS